MVSGFRVKDEKEHLKIDGVLYRELKPAARGESNRVSCEDAESQQSLGFLYVVG